MVSDRGQIERRRRRLREELRALSAQPLMRGSVVERHRRCGRPNCAVRVTRATAIAGRFSPCICRGATQAVHLRPADEAAVRAAVAAYQRLWQLIDGLTACELADLRRQARERRRARQRRRGAR
jgi:hypothetical protein